MKPLLLLRFILLTWVVLYQGCATRVSNQFVENVRRPDEFAQFFELLDHTVQNAGVRDAANFPVASFPYLRTNRFLTGLKDELQNDAQYEQWVLWLQQLDLNARIKEIQNLPEDELKNLAAQLGETPDRRTLQHRLAYYSDKLLTYDKGQPAYYTAVQASVKNPDEYSTLLRVVGLYPLTSLPVAVFTHRAQDKFRKWHQTPFDHLDTLGELTAYGPSQSIAYSEPIVRLIINRSRQNALNVPIPSIADQNVLLAMFAPVLYQDVAADYDKIGEVFWNGNQVGINAQKPTAYYYFSHARLEKLPVLQLNYVFWYSAREGPKSPWFERGKLDGMTVRISLDDEGRPFMLDIMNNCGCYHFFVPNQQKVKQVIPTPQEIDAFVPRWLPESFPQARLYLRINSGWHQVDHLGTDGNVARFLPYRLVPYDYLEILAHDDNNFASLFNAKGIAKNSGRIEPLFFFPMGIPDVGSMRQRGHHAVKLVGRAYFDDPELFNQNFEFE